MELTNNYKFYTMANHAFISFVLKEDDLGDLESNIKNINGAYVDDVNIQYAISVCVTNFEFDRENYKFVPLPEWL